MDELKKDGKPKMKSLIGDAFKTLTNAIVTTFQVRRYKIKKELLPSYRPLCKAAASATHLFGDKMDEEIKQLKEKKQQLSTKKHFLGKRPGMMAQVLQYRRHHTFGSPSSKIYTSSQNYHQRRKRQFSNYKPKQQKKEQPCQEHKTSNMACK